jgi:hypothetical protein
MCAEHDRQAGQQRDRKGGKHQPAPAAPANTKRQRGQPRADQREDGEVRGAVRVAASRVGHRGKQHADHGAEKIFLVPDRPEEDQRHQHDIQDHDCSRPV